IASRWRPRAAGWRTRAREDATPVGSPPLANSVQSKDVSVDPRRPGGTAITPRTANQLPLLHAARIPHIQLRPSTARRAEEKIATIGRPPGIDVVAGARGELLRLAPARTDDEDLKASADAPGVGDLVAARRPDGRGVVRSRVSEPAHAAAARVGDVDL